jgi:hypothetical protein
MKNKDIRVGDWVRFMRNGLLVLSEVEYVKKDRLSYIYGMDIITTNGSVPEKDILEIRREKVFMEEEND